MVRLTTPIDKDTVVSLKVGDMVLITGTIYTGRDKVHKHLVNEKPDRSKMPFDLTGGVIYHCGPILKKTDDTYQIIAGGPTTSSRMDLYEPDVIRTYGLRAIVGKGGMSSETTQAMKECGCVYLNAINGAAVYLADSIKRVLGGWMVEEFGAPEAMWALEVEDFPAIVTIDAHGNSLHQQVKDTSYKNIVSVL